MKEFKGWVVETIILTAILWTFAMMFAPPCRAQQMEERAPLTEYKQWYADMALCSGVVHPAIPFSSLRYIVVHAPVFPVEGRGAYLGYTFLSDSTIYVVADSAASKLVISHEMLHAIIGRPGHGPMFDTCGVAPGDPLRSWPTNGVEDG